MSADWWQNFANNFAADLAPLISLFGEAPTKQYLSETLTFLDVFIFSMAPIGVITALVSAIRVAGSPTLRSFIGRAQEGAGIAEAELCSSTSRNVCEMYNNGGIARVFGRPKILEFVHDWKRDTPPDQQNQNPHDEAGIYSFRNYLSLKHWKDKKLKELPDNENGTEPHYPPHDFAPHPNLSLNVGITKHHVAWFYLAAILGFALQAGVVVFAALVTYKYPRKFQRDDTQIAVPAFQFVCAGTALLCSGAGMCAFIIERSTYERTFKRKDDHPSRLYWVQPGDQVVGDQVFESFAYSDAKVQIKEYTTSKRVIEMGNDSKQFRRQQSILAWIATFTTTVGFVLQFLGLRTVHSTVSVAQLGAMLIMSAVRALLRTRRLREEHNLLGDLSTLYLHHELDWLAIEMAQENEKYSPRGLLSQNRISKPIWHIIGPGKTPLSSHPGQQSMCDELDDKAAKAYFKRVRLAQMTGAQTLASTVIINDPWEDVMISSRRWASKLAGAIEGVIDVIDRQCTVKDTLRQAQIHWSIRCWMNGVAKTWERNFNLSGNTIQLTAVRDTEGTGLHGPCQADRAQLESVLGLWLWSIVSVQRIRQVDEKDPSGSSNFAQRASRLIYVSGDLDSSDAETSLRIWLGNNSTLLQAASLMSVDVAFHPSSLWVDKKGDDIYRQISEYDSPEKRHPTARRIFGSNVIPTGILDDIKGKLLRVLHLPSASSLEMMCAQELFTIFLHTIAFQIEEIGGYTEILKGPDRHYVANSTLSEMVEAFTSSGIGNYDDAIACIVPALHSAQKLSYSTVFMAARATGEKYYQRDDLKRAEEVLFSALELAYQDFDGKVIHLPGDTERTAAIHVCLLSLCELYRWELLGDKRTTLFGLRGFISLFKLFRRRRRTGVDVSIDDQEEIPEDLLLYWNVALNLSKGEKDDIYLVHAIQELREQVVGPYYEFLEDFHISLHWKNLAGTLCALKPSIRDSCTGRAVLAIAAQHGWYPVMKSLKRLGIDTREVDHNGLNYLHHAAQSCDALMFKDLIGDDMELLEHKDTIGRTPLHLSAAAGRTDTVTLLTKYPSVKWNIRDNFLRSPLDHAILSDHLDTFTLLSNFEKEGRVESFPGYGWSSETSMLFQAACCGSTKIILELLSNIVSLNLIEQLRPATDELLRCKIDLETKDGANSKSFIRILDILGECGHDAEKWHIKGRTGLSFAAEANNADLIIYLLDRYELSSIIGADERGRNCLHHAVIAESESAVEALIDSTCACDLLLARDQDDLDPLECAVRNKSFAIASILIRKDHRKQLDILPGTAITADPEWIHFQGTDSQIWRTSLASSHERSPCVIRSGSARLYTPLATVNMHGVHHIFYISKENTIGHLRSLDKGEGFEEGPLQREAIKIDVTSSLAAVCSGDFCYLYYQDQQNSICQIELPRYTECHARFSPLVVAVASQGSDIVAVSDHRVNSQRRSSWRVYYLNLYFGVEMVSIKETRFNTRTIEFAAIMGRNSDFSAIVHGCENMGFLWCDKEGYIRRLGASDLPSKAIDETRWGQTRFAVDSDRSHVMLYHQTKLGGIRKVELRMPGDMAS